MTLVSVMRRIGERGFLRFWAQTARIESTRRIRAKVET